MPLTTRQIAQLVGGELVGPADVAITSIERVDAAGPGQVTFVTDERYAQRWAHSRAAAAIVARSLSLSPSNGQAVIHVDDVDRAVIRVLEAMAPPPVVPAQGVHASAVVESSAMLGASVRIGAQCYIGADVRLGDGVVLHPNVTVLDGCSIGPGTVLWSGVVVRDRCVIGARCIVHPNTTIGADGFGYRPAGEGAPGAGMIKVPQIGNVVIGDDVEIGAATCIDRAKFGATQIGDGTKIDNLCQIAHNCRIGRHVIMAAGCGIAGSAVVEDGAVFGGYASVRDHITIGAGATILGRAAVMNDVPAGETWAGYPAKDAKIAAREYAAMRRLPEMIKLLKKRD